MMNVIWISKLIYDPCWDWFFSGSRLGFSEDISEMRCIEVLFRLILQVIPAKTDSSVDLG